MAEIVEALQDVDSLDDDRVLRRIALLVGAIQRTNFYQPAADGAPKPYISFKVASRRAGRPAGAQAVPRDLRLGASTSRACTCASARWPAAACAGATGATTSAPRCWAW